MSSLVLRNPKPVKVEEQPDFVRPAIVKISDLPITAAQRASIDELVTKFTRKGDFDNLRKTIITRFDQSDAKNDFIAALEELTERELDKQPQLLGKDRRISAQLIAGVAERSDIYRNVESVLGQYMREALTGVEETLRGFRRAQVGDDVAKQEQDKGKKSDAQYKKEADERHSARLKAYYEERARNLQLEIEEATRKKAEAAKLKEERDKMYQEMREKREKEKEEFRTKLREQERAQRERELEDEKDREERRKMSRRVSNEPPSLPPTEKELEAIALQELLKEGEKAAKERQLPGLDRDKSRGTPPHKAMLTKTLGPPGRRESIPASTRAASISSDHPSAPRDGLLSREDSRLARPDERRSDRYEGDRPARLQDSDRARDDDRRGSRYEADRSYDRPKGRFDDRDDRGGRRESTRYRSRSRSPIRTTRDRDDRDYQRRSRSRQRSRSRDRRRDLNDRYRDERPRRDDRGERDDGRNRRGHTRSRSPPGIDRYVPSSAARRERSKERDRSRDRDRDRGADRVRDRERERRDDRKDDRRGERRDTHRDSRGDRYEGSKRDERERDTTAGAGRDHRDSRENR